MVEAKNNCNFNQIELLLSFTALLASLNSGEQRKASQRAFISRRESSADPGRVQNGSISVAKWPQNIPELTRVEISIPLSRPRYSTSRLFRLRSRLREGNARAILIPETDILLARTRERAAFVKPRNTVFSRTLRSRVRC